MRPIMTAKTTAACLKRSCAQQRTVRKLFKGAFMCQRPQLYTNQVSHRSMQDYPVTKNADGRTDIYYVLKSHLLVLWQRQRFLCAV